MSDEIGIGICWLEREPCVNPENDPDEDYTCFDFASDYRCKNCKAIEDGEEW